MGVRPRDGVGIVDFGIPRKRKEALHEGGYQACEEFLERWDFEGYIDEFRSGKEHSRTEAVARQIQGLAPV